MTFTIDYPEDGDTEDLDQALFDEARAFYNQNPQPKGPIDMVRLQSSSKINYSSNIFDNLIHSVLFAVS